MALFEFGPFRGWQQAFSTKSALGWIDRAGLLTRGMDGGYSPTTAGGGTFLGLGVFAVLVAGLGRGIFHASPEGRKARRFLVFSLLLFWLSFGPKGVLGGHFFFLTLSPGAADFTPALGWFLLAAQVWAIFQLVPPGWPLRHGVGTLVSLVYLLVPGFRVIEWLPIYKNIRAPFDFFQVTGMVCVVIAAAIAARILFSKLSPGVLRSAVAAAVSCLVVLDAAPYARPFFQGALGREVFDDFLSAEEFIRTSPVPGRVHAFSGRYFYLLTPYLTGRPLVSEAFNSYLQQRGAALLQATAFFSDQALGTYLSISGVSHVLIDKTDPDTSPEIQGRLRGLLPVGYENERFAVLENKGSLAAGFLARDFVQAADTDPGVAVAALGAAGYGVATIELNGIASDAPGLVGRIADGRVEPITPDAPVKEGRAFQAVPESGPGSYQAVAFAPSGGAGWLVMNQAWHPDWRASQGGKPLQIRRAFVAFSAVQTDGISGVEFRFEQPWWYNLCAGIGLLSWVFAVGLVLFSRARAMDRIAG